MASPSPRVLLSWSSGKDSAWALHVLRHDSNIEIVGLLTTIARRPTGWRCTPAGGTVRPENFSNPTRIIGVQSVCDSATELKRVQGGERIY
jgi:hypothetical protein